MNLIFQHVRGKRMSKWLIRRPASWTNDGKYTIGKIHKHPVTEALSLSLNGQTHLTYEETKAVVAFMNTIEASA